ncbi:MAG: hypothetical protein GX833_02795 [Clostridium sp.]|nr:hypothetical protein [Clostridium sp.]
MIKRKLKGPVPKGARIFAGLLMVINGIVLASLLFIVSRPDLLREPLEGNQVLTEAEIQVVLSEAPIVLVVTGIILLGLILILFKKAWGYILYALPMLFNGINNLRVGETRGFVTSLLQVTIMGLLIFLVGSRPAKARPIQQGEPSNYRYNVDEE